MNIFYNQNEQRLRAGWRLFLQFVIMILIAGTSAWGLSFFLSGGTSLAVINFIGIIASVWIAARYFDKRPFTDYGIAINKRWVKEYFIGIAIAAAAQGMIFLIEWAAGWVSVTNYGWNVETKTSFGLGFGGFFISMLLVGFHEELFSRGYQILNLTEGLRYPTTGQRGALIISVILTSSLFGLMHFFNPNASAISTFNIILAGIVLAIPFVLTGRLALSAGLHFSWNFMMAGILGFPVSGMQIETTVLHIQQNGTELWTGGAFGPEAGLIGLFGMAIMLGGSCVYIKLAGYELTTAELFTKEYQPAVKSDEQTA